MINVLHVIARMNVGGPAFELQALQSEFSRFNINSQIITGRCSSDEQDFLSNHSIAGEIHYLDVLQRDISFTKDLVAFFRLRRMIVSSSPHIVHTHTSKAGFLARMAALTLRRRPRLIHTFHGHVFDGYFRGIKKSVFLSLERLLGRFTDLFFCIGSRTQDDIVRLGISPTERTQLVPTSMIFSDSYSKVEAREKLGISLDAFVVIFFGRLAPIKRIDRLIQVISMAQNLSNIVWVIVGDGAERGLIDAFAANSQQDIRILGWRSDVQEILPGCDISILVSDSEGTPLSIVEAGYYGVPTVSTNVGSVKDLIIDKENGILVGREPQAIYGAIAALANNRDRLVELSQTAKSHFRGKFSPYISASIHAECYRKVTKR